MITSRKLIKIQENIGVADRFVRMIAGSVLIIPLLLTMTIPSSFLTDWQVLPLIGSFYLLLTGMMGWDPIYALFHSQSCSVSGKNPCGTFMYQMNTALGNHPENDQGYYDSHFNSGKPIQRVTGTFLGACWI